jgi:hypothetical protein
MRIARQIYVDRRIVEARWAISRPDVTSRVYTAMVETCSVALPGTGNRASPIYIPSHSQLC